MEQTLRDRLVRLSPSEKAEAIQLLVADLGGPWPGIEKHAGVCGGDACVVRTRIPVWLLEQMRRLGSSDAEILANYPSLNREDVLNAWSYAAAHAEEIDQAIAENEELESEIG
jgi:uncharacterized protein (DUF433 family)